MVLSLKLFLRLLIMEQLYLGTLWLSVHPLHGEGWAGVQTCLSRAPGREGISPSAAESDTTALHKPALAVLSGRKPVGYSQPTNINYCSSQAAEEWILLGQIPKSLKI